MLGHFPPALSQVPFFSPTLVLFRTHSLTAQGRTTTDYCLAVLQLPSCPCACEFVIPSDFKFAAGCLAGWLAVVMR